MYKNIVVPVDVFDAGLADKALSHAKFLAQHSAGQIHLVHVIPAFSPVLTRGFISDARKMEEHLISTAKEKLSDLVKKNSLAEETSHLYVRSGNIRDQVIDLADELKADVVIVGSRNPGSRPIFWALKRQTSCATPMYRFSLCADDGGMSS